MMARVLAGHHLLTNPFDGESFVLVERASTVVDELEREWL